MTATTASITVPSVSTSAAGPTLRARYRAAYEKLPPGVQLIGLQVWLPAFFVIAFCFCYIAAFHAPAPSDVPVAIVGSGSATSQFAETLQHGSNGALAVSTESSVAAARAAVRDGQLAGAYVPGNGTATVIIASAGSYQLATLAKTYLSAVGTAAHATVTVTDVAPLPAGDSFGTSVFYLTLVWMISGYMIAMFVGMMGGALSHRWRFSILAGSSIVLPAVSSAIAHFVLHAVDAPFMVLWGIGAATAFTVGLVVNGLAFFLGRFVTGAALLVFVFANVPASGGAYPPELLHEPFRSLHSVVSGTAVVDLLRRVTYHVGPDVWSGWLLLGIYAAIGLVLAFVGKPFAARRTRRRAARGVPPTMMATAQMAAMALARGHNAAPSAHAAHDHDAAATRTVRAEQQSEGVASAATAVPEPVPAPTRTGASAATLNHGRHAAPVAPDAGMTEVERSEAAREEEAAARDTELAADESGADAAAAVTGAAG